MRWLVIFYLLVFLLSLPVALIATAVGLKLIFEVYGLAAFAAACVSVVVSASGIAFLTEKRGYPDPQRRECPPDQTFRR